MMPKELKVEVCKILMEHWDPIEIRDVPAAQDEYDTYALSFAQMILDKKPRSEISKRLLEIETAAMGLRGNKDRALSVADRLLTLTGQCD